MTRVATVPMHRSLFDAIGRSQQRLAETQQQMATGKKALDLASLGSGTVRTLSAHTMLERQEAHGTVAKRLESTLALTDAHLTSTEEAAATLKTRLMEVIGTGRSAGLQGAIEEAFQAFRTAMNADEGGTPLFAGAQQERPFKPASLSDAAATAAVSAFTNDTVKATARLADGLDVEVGIVASEVGTELFEAFRLLGAAGPVGDAPTAAQTTALTQAVDWLGKGIDKIRDANAENGRRQAQVETLAERADQRSLILRQLIGKAEDADMAAVASELVQRQTTLEASYTVFSRLSQLTLVNFLR